MHERRTAKESTSNTKLFFTYIRIKKKVKNNIDPLTKESGVPTQDNKHMAKILITNFASVYTIKNIQSIPESAPPQREIEPLEIGGIREHEVKRC